MKTKQTYKEKLKNIIKSLPQKPGIYQYFDENAKILYIGKAKNLKKRVSSYFTKSHNDWGKIRVLVSKIRDIQTIVVDTELDALLLERNLVHKYQPRYNAQLKDSKSFPWICIKNEPFPRVFYTRTLIKDGSEYYGPYASVGMMKTVLHFAKSLYLPRTCNLKLSNKNIEKGKFKICLEYHIGNCLGACEAHQSEDDYNKSIDAIRQIVKGNIGSVIQQVKKQMMDAADDMNFEKAQGFKNKLYLLEQYKSRTTIVSSSIRNVDVFSIINDKKEAFINYLKVLDGAIVQTHSSSVKKKLAETEQELLELSVSTLRERYKSNAKEIILPFPINIALDNVRQTIPKIGDKKKLLELSEKNVKYFRLEKNKQRDLIDPNRHSKRILEQMRKDLRMKEKPAHIECFDNSNFQGDYPVAAMVCFRKAKPYKKEYRHYIIKTVIGPDDFSSMAEIIFRRYKRLLKEEKPLPQLIVVDGGKGQLSAALKSLEKLDLRGKITIIGIAKKLEEIYYPDDSIPLFLDKTSETLRIIRHLRDEAHRFGISHHRKRFEKGLIKTELTEIKGIGKETAKKLLLHFKSIKKLQESTTEEIEKIVGKSKTALLKKYFSAD